MPDQLRLFKIKADVSINKMVIPYIITNKAEPCLFLL